MRLDIRYVTRFRYGATVAESQNELRACPATDDRQALVHYHVTTTPSSRVATYLDYWGSRVDTFGVRVPHTTLEVVADATVETVRSPAPDAPVLYGADGPVPVRELAPVPLEELADPEFVDRHLEVLQRSPHANWGETVAVAASRCRDAVEDDVLSLVLAIHDRVAALEYREGETYVGVSVEKVFAEGGGVCQDFAHLAVALYRSVGIPARYVSGYLFAVDDATGADADTDEVEVETHAWVEVAIPGWGWLALDPTNSLWVGERHVTIGRGRDYDDVAPFRGVYSGGAEHELDVAVTMRRLARDPLAGLPGSDRRTSRRLGPPAHPLTRQQVQQAQQ